MNLIKKINLKELFENLKIFENYVFYEFFILIDFFIIAISHSLLTVNIFLLKRLFCHSKLILIWVGITFSFQKLFGKKERVKPHQTWP